MIDTDQILANSRLAARRFLELDQMKTDRIVRAVYLAALDNRIRLAKHAEEETGIGRWRDKVIKNVIASQLVYENIKNQRTVGVISEDHMTGIVEIAQPIGPILGLIPVLNPTSTVIFKSLISLKTRNPIIFSPSFTAKNSAAEASKICYEAALSAGAPEHCIQWLEKPILAKTKELMSHYKLAMILATGAGEIVRASYSSGTPTIGVGAGNVPVYIGATADVPFAVKSILFSKTFDNGSICASEQAIVIKEKIARIVIEEFKRHGVYFMNDEETEKVGRIAYDRERRVMSAGVVGQSVERIAQMAGIEVPKGTVVLASILDSVSPDQPLSAEILAPILAFYIEPTFKKGIARCAEITHFGGTGHSAVIYSNNPERIEYFSRTVDVARILVNTPSTHGAIGGMFTTLSPSFTLSCGSGGRNSTTDNISTRNLLNIHRICRRRINERWFNMDTEKYYDERVTAEKLEKEFNRNS